MRTAFVARLKISFKMLLNKFIQSEDPPAMRMAARKAAWGVFEQKIQALLGLLLHFRELTKPRRL